MVSQCRAETVGNHSLSYFGIIEVEITISIKRLKKYAVLCKVKIKHLSQSLIFYRTTSIAFVVIVVVVH